MGFTRTILFKIQHLEYYNRLFIKLIINTVLDYYYYYNVNLER